jgi:hypothetical protein
LLYEVRRTAALVLMDKKGIVRCSPHLRRTLWMMAHLGAVTTAALKLTRIVWRILTDQRDYIPAARPAKS